MRRAVQSYARLLLVSIVVLSVYGFFVVSAEAGRYCFGERCYSRLFVNEFDKIQDAYKSESLPKLCFQGRGCVERWPMGTFRKTPDTHGICVGNNCVTDGAPIIKNVNVSTKGGRGGQRYEGNYFVEGEVVSQPYYMAGAVLKYSDEFKKWIDANDHIKLKSTGNLELDMITYYNKLTKFTGAFSDAKHPFDLYFRQHTGELVDPSSDRSLDLMKISPLTDFSNFTCHDVSGRREFVYNDIYRAVTFGGGGNKKSYEEELLCKIRYKNAIGLEAVEKFKVGKFQRYPPEASITKNAYYDDREGATLIDIIGNISAGAGAEITESYIEAIHCGNFRYTPPPPPSSNRSDSSRYSQVRYRLWTSIGGSSGEITERISNDYATRFYYPLCDTRFRFVVKSKQGDAVAEVEAKSNKYGSWKEGRRYARTMEDYLYQQGLTQQELNDRASTARRGSGMIAIPQDPDRYRINWNTDPPKKQYKFPDPLPPCSDKPPVSGGIWKLENKDYGDLNLYWPVYKCSGKEIRCYDVLPRCFNVDLQSSQKPTQCDQGLGLFGFAKKNYGPNNEPWYVVLLEESKAAFFGGRNRTAEHIREKYRVVECQDHVIDSSEDYNYSDELRLGNTGRGNDWNCARSVGFPVDYDGCGSEIRYRQPPQFSRQAPDNCDPSKDPNCAPPSIQPVYQGSCGATADRDCNTLYVNKPAGDVDIRNTSVGHAEVGQGRAEKTKDGKPIQSGIDANEFQTRLTEQRIRHEGSTVVGTNANDGKPVLRPLNPVTDKEVDAAMQLTPQERKEKLENVGKGDAVKSDRTTASLGVAPDILKTKFNSPCNTLFPSNILHVCYFDNRNAALTAEKSIFQTDEFKITEPLRSGNMLYNKWGEGFISMTGKSDNVSAVWRGDLLFEEGDYTFVIASDDGVELNIDGKKIIRDWSSHAEKEYSRKISLTKGYHKIQLRWYEHGGAATLTFGWRKE